MTSCFETINLNKTSAAKTDLSVSQEVATLHLTLTRLPSLDQSVFLTSHYFVVAIYFLLFIINVLLFIQYSTKNANDMFLLETIVTKILTSYIHYTQILFIL